tara:strand:- start:1478 stop:2281 length:804 start_codon:yes stop_codon:yes gene_type:complete
MAKPKKNIQAWAITYADMVTLLLTFFVLLLVILSEAERQVDYQITKLLDKAHKQMEAALTEESIDVERATKGVKITIRGKLFKQLSPDIEPRYNKVIGQIGELIKQTDIMSIDFVKAGLDSAHEYFGLVNELENRGQELAIEIRCEGHTDDAPIPKDMKIEYESNWQLSSDRSLNVVKLMRQYASMPEKYFSALGYGPHRPLISIPTIRSKKNKREKDKLREYNRRVEIYLDAFARDKTQTDEQELINRLTGKKKTKKVEVTIDQTS